MSGNDSSSGRGVGSSKAEIHKTTCMILYEHALDYLIMHEHVCDANA